MIIVMLVSQPSDTLPVQGACTTSYTRQIVINGAIGALFGASAAIFYTLGNRAYENYRTDTTITQAAADWSRVEFYDNARNVCGVGSAVFILRAVYYQVKQAKASRTTGIAPRLDYHYAERKLSLGIIKGL
jgi:hypothetical protein